MSYHPQVVLESLERHALVVNLLDGICFTAVLIYYWSAVRTAARHKAFPVPFAACGWYTIHDFFVAAQWEKWSTGYAHPFPEMQAIACLIFAFMEAYLCYLVYKYGREELLPQLTQKQFGLVLLATLVGIGVVWGMIKQTIDDDLCIIAFAVTTWWPQVWNTQLMMKRQSQRGMSIVMLWSLVASPIGMMGAWYFLDPYFRSPLWLSFFAVTVLWAFFNIWYFKKLPKYVAVMADTSHATMLSDVIKIGEATAPSAREMDQRRDRGPARAQAD